MAKRPYRWKWTATIDPESLPQLQKLAERLNFVVRTPGGYLGKPAPAMMLDAIAAAYRRDPSGVKLAFKVLGITPDGQPSFTSDTAQLDAAEPTE